MSDYWDPDQSSNEDSFSSSEPEQEQSVWDGESTHPVPEEQEWEKKPKKKAEPESQTYQSSSEEKTWDEWEDEQNGQSVDEELVKKYDDEEKKAASDGQTCQSSTEEETWDEWEDEQNGQSVDEDLVKQQEEEEKKAAIESQICQSTPEDTWDYTKPVWAQTDNFCEPGEEFEPIDEKYLLVNQTVYNPDVWDDPLGPREKFEEIDQGGHGRIHYCWRNDNGEFVERTVGTSGCLAVSVVMVLHHYNFMSKATIKQKIADLVQFMRGYKRSQNIISRPKCVPSYDYITPQANPKTEKFLAAIPKYTKDTFVVTVITSDQDKLAWYQKCGLEVIDSEDISPLEIVREKGGKLIFSTKGGVKGGYNIDGKEVVGKDPEKGYMAKGHFVVISGYNNGLYEIADPAGDRKGAGDLSYISPDKIKDKTFIWIRPTGQPDIPLSTEPAAYVDLYESVLTEECKMNLAVREEIENKWVYIFDYNMDTALTEVQCISEDGARRVEITDLQSKQSIDYDSITTSSNIPLYPVEGSENPNGYSFLLSPFKLPGSAIDLLLKVYQDKSYLSKPFKCIKRHSGIGISDSKSVGLVDPLRFIVQICNYKVGPGLNDCYEYSKWTKSSEGKREQQEYFIASVLDQWYNNPNLQSSMGKVFSKGVFPYAFMSDVENKQSKAYHYFESGTSIVAAMLRTPGYKALEEGAYAAEVEVADKEYCMEEDMFPVFNLSYLWVILCNNNILASEACRDAVQDVLANKKSFIVRHVFQPENTEDGNGALIFKASRAGNIARVALTAKLSSAWNAHRIASGISEGMRKPIEPPVLKKNQKRWIKILEEIYSKREQHSSWIEKSSIKVAIDRLKKKRLNPKKNLRKFLPDFEAKDMVLKALENYSVDDAAITELNSVTKADNILDFIDELDSKKTTPKSPKVDGNAKKQAEDALKKIDDLLKTGPSAKVDTGSGSIVTSYHKYFEQDPNYKLVNTEYQKSMKEHKFSGLLLFEMFNTSMAIADALAIESFDDEDLIGSIGTITDLAGELDFVFERFLSKKSVAIIGGGAMVVSAICDSYIYYQMATKASKTGDTNAAAGAYIATAGGVSATVSGGINLARVIFKLGSSWQIVSMRFLGVAGVLITVGVIIYMLCKDSIYEKLAKGSFLLADQGYDPDSLEIEETNVLKKMPVPSPEDRQIEYENFVYISRTLSINKYDKRKISVDFSNYERDGFVEIVVAKHRLGDESSIDKSYVYYYRYHFDKTDMETDDSSYYNAKRCYLNKKFVDFDPAAQFNNFGEDKKALQNRYPELKFKYQAKFLTNILIDVNAAFAPADNPMSKWNMRVFVRYCPSHRNNYFIPATPGHYVDGKYRPLDDWNKPSGNNDKYEYVNKPWLQLSMPINDVSGSDKKSVSSLEYQKFVFVDDNYIKTWLGVDIKEVWTDDSHDAGETSGSNMSQNEIDDESSDVAVDDASYDNDGDVI